MTHLSELSQDFEAFHEANPHVYNALATYARQWRTVYPSKKVGIGRFVEIVRWDFELRTFSQDYKIANAHRAFYARLIMALEKDLKGIFNTSSSEADRWITGYLERQASASA